MRSSSFPGIGGDAIGVFATAFGSELQSEGNVLNNAKLVYDGTS